MKPILVHLALNLLLVLFLCAVLPVQAAMAGVAGDEETFLGAVLPLDLGANQQTMPAVAWHAGCNRFLEVHQSFVNGVDNDLWGRYLDGPATAVASGLFRLTPSPAEQRAPAVAFNPGGPNFLVVWMDRRAGNWDIYARRWDCAKQPVGPAIRITGHASDQMYPDVACIYGMCWIVWEDMRAGNWDIFGQRISAAGVLQGGNVPLTTHPARQQAVAIAANPENTGCGLRSFLAVWDDSRNAATAADIYSQQLNDLGLCGGNQPVYAGRAAQTDPDVAYGTADHRYQVVWRDERNAATASDIFGRRALPNGVGDGPSIAVSVAARHQMRPAIAYDDDDNEFLTVWQDFRSGGWDIYRQRTTGLGALVGGNLPVMSGDISETYPAVAYGRTNDHFAVIWDSSGDIRGRAYWP